MCGFVGSFLNVNNLESDLFFKLGRLSKHRGPDDTDVWFDNKYKVLFNRLAIIELTEAGRQPMKSLSGEWLVVFNGEIYNHLELRERLPDYIYKGKSDTETLTLAIESWGIEKTLQEINGMFAIAAYNKAKNTLCLARDFAGIKPLFYSTGTEHIWFASQFNQVIEGIGKQKVTLNKAGMRDFLQLGYMQAPETIYDEIKQVLPGEMVEFDLSGNKKHKRFYELPKYSQITKDNELSESQDFSNLMIKVLKDQMLSDVPLGSFLSSGIDSTLVSGFASKSNKNINTFTIGVNDYEADERKKAAKYSNILGLNHISSAIDNNEILDAVDCSNNLMTEPFGDYSSIPTFLITKYARNYNTVMLSGDGGDELFWGYTRWNTFLENYENFKYPKSIRRIKTYLNRRIKNNSNFAYGQGIFNTPGEWVLNSQSHNNSEVMDNLIPNSENSEAVKNLYNFSYGKSQIEFRNWLRWNEFYGHLQRVLIKVDRMSMANSLEVRVPFLDKRIIEFAWNRKSSYGLKHFVNKQFLKKQLTQFIPDNEINHTKIGFSVPIDEWLKTTLRNLVENKLLHSKFYGEEFIDQKALEKYIKGYFSGIHNSSWGIWILYAWQKWGEYMSSAE